jgi:hypothetical protein
VSKVDKEEFVRDTLQWPRGKKAYLAAIVEARAPSNLLAKLERGPLVNVADAVAVDATAKLAIVISSMVDTVTVHSTHGRLLVVQLGVEGANFTLTAAIATGDGFATKVSVVIGDKFCKADVGQNNNEGGFGDGGKVHFLVLNAASSLKRRLMS